MEDRGAGHAGVRGDVDALPVQVDLASGESVAVLVARREAADLHLGVLEVEPGEEDGGTEHLGETRGFVLDEVARRRRALGVEFEPGGAGDQTLFEGHLHHGRFLGAAAAEGGEGESERGGDCSGSAERRRRGVPAGGQVVSHGDGSFGARRPSVLPGPRPAGGGTPRRGEPPILCAAGPPARGGRTPAGPARKRVRRRPNRPAGSGRRASVRAGGFAHTPGGPPHDFRRSPRPAGRRRTRPCPGAPGDDDAPVAGGAGHRRPGHAGGDLFRNGSGVRGAAVPGFGTGDRCRSARPTGRGGGRARRRRRRGPGGPAGPPGEPPAARLRLRLVRHRQHGRRARPAGSPRARLRHPPDFPVGRRDRVGLRRLPRRRPIAAIRGGDRGRRRGRRRTRLHPPRAPVAGPGGGRRRPRAPAPGHAAPGAGGDPARVSPLARWPRPEARGGARDPGPHRDRSRRSRLGAGRPARRRVAFRRCAGLGGRRRQPGDPAGFGARARRAGIRARPSHAPDRLRRPGVRGGRLRDARGLAGHREGRGVRGAAGALPRREPAPGGGRPAARPLPAAAGLPDAAEPR